MAASRYIFAIILVTFLYSAGLLGTGICRSLASSSCPSNPDNLNEYLVIGHAGGDPIGQCENTLESAASGLLQGMNAVEIDVCMSKDGVVFLWHDCNMSDPLAMFRRLGYFLPRKTCVPYNHPSVNGKEPTQLAFNVIRKCFGYRSAWNRKDRLPYVVPTFREFLRSLGGKIHQLKRFYLDMKLHAPHLQTTFATNLLSVAREFGIEHKLLLAYYGKEKARRALQLPVFQGPRRTSARIALDIGLGVDDLFGTNLFNDLHVADGLLRWALENSKSQSLQIFSNKKLYFYQKTLLPRVIKNAWRNFGKTITQLVRKYDVVGSAEELCISYASLGYLLSANEAYKNIIERSLARRQKTGYNVKLIAWTIESSALLRWLRQTQMNGVITDYPSRAMAVNSVNRKRSFAPANSVWY